MNFDHTYIAIRRRNILEIFDLSLHVIRDYFTPLFVLWLAGSLPFMLINWLMIGWLGADYYDTESLFAYFYLMALLIIIQSHVATMPITIYLGKSMFSESPGIRETLLATIKSNPFIFWVHGVLRMAIPAMLLALLINADVDDGTFLAASIWLTLAVALGMMVRIARPFASEILCLEKTPVFKKNDYQITYGVRSHSLHRAASGQLFSRFCVIYLLAIPLTITVVGTLLSIDSLLNLFSSYDSLPTVFYGPVACWIVAGIIAVVRFLSYIDTRIRQEGWEVELRLRAEAIRLQQALGANQ